jgi:hypothetical protein
MHDYPKEQRANNLLVSNLWTFFNSCIIIALWFRVSDLLRWILATFFLWFKSLWTLWQDSDQTSKYEPNIYKLGIIWISHNKNFMGFMSNLDILKGFHDSLAFPWVSFFFYMTHPHKHTKLGMKVIMWEVIKCGIDCKCTCSTLVQSYWVRCLQCLTVHNANYQTDLGNAFSSLVTLF